MAASSSRLSVTDDKRALALPDVPTSAEEGFPAIRMQHWGGIYAPKGTPAQIMDRVAQAMLVAFRGDSDLRAQLERYGYRPETGTRADFTRFIETEKNRLGKIVRDSHMTLD
ncbi:tripartite tricarboxylate transporter substrate-binding protein [Cupriavidus lacunae]|uniref:tripartite tricarboxylate transporter substrate-binding protein n=1 Tax=Cupriavidus lacunae TaxID=2666307 RepID=UPI001FC9C587|nr:tripartite tricarboxylate transporter substrate-binding protein [Cupriavidus lacunae]